MPLNIPLTQLDRNVLVDLKEDTQDQNNALNASQSINAVALARLLLIDIPFKKQTDAPHDDIYYFEEELRRLNGISIPQPLQELSFTISDSATTARLYINNGRVKLVEDSNTILDVPIIPFRGYSFSQLNIGTDFDIWSRDRFGSSTSKRNVGNSFYIDSTNSKLKVTINGDTQEIDYSELFVLPQTTDGGILASSLQAIFQGIEVGSTLSTNAEPYILYENDKLNISVNNGPTQTAIFTTGDSLYVNSYEQDYFTFLNGDILNLSIDEGSNQPLIFIFPSLTFTFSVSDVIITPTVGDTYIQNSSIYQIDYSDSEQIQAHRISGNNDPLTTGTLNRVTGSGDETISYTSVINAFGSNLDRQTITIEEVAIAMNNAWTGMTASIDLSTGKKRLKLQLDIAGYHNFLFSNESNLPGPGRISTNSSIYIAGVDTKFTETFQVGDRITIQGENVFRIIASITDDTHLILTTPTITVSNAQYFYVGSGNSDPIGVLGLSDQMYGTFTAQKVIDTLNWAGVTFSIEDGQIRVSSGDKFQITDSDGSPNQIIGFSEHLILQNTNFQTCGVNFNTELNTFTINSGVAGPTSTVEVIPATSNDMMTTLGFDSQYQITGRWLNNLLRVSIDDSDPVDIKIADFRLCFNDLSLGNNNDDIGFYWSGDTTLGYSGTTRVGPLFCSGINNGKDVAKSIQAQLRAVGTGGFTNATCHYFTDKQQFVIYSGTFGTTSAVNVIDTTSFPNSYNYNTLLFGFVPPLEERGHEQYYFTIGELNTLLDTLPNVTVTTPTDPSIFCHSILYTTSEIPTGVGSDKLDGVRLDAGFQLYPVTTTIIYDQGALGLPRLYPNGTITVDATNDKIDYWQTINTERTVTLTHGTYTTADMALVIVAVLGTSFSVLYQNKRFTISSSTAFALLWNTGSSKYTSIGDVIGFDTTTDTSLATSHTSTRDVTFTGDYNNPTFISQFDGLPTAVDETADEQSAIIFEEYILNIEGPTDTLLDDIKNETTYDNETKLNVWEDFAVREYDKVVQEDTALLLQKACYADHINENDTDSEIIAKTDAYNNLQNNKNDLASNLTNHAKLLNLTSDNRQFIAGSDFSQGGSQSLNVTIPVGLYDARIYNRPASYVYYQNINQHIAGRWTGLFSDNATYQLGNRPAFSIANTRVGTQGYSFSGANALGTYTIPGALPANILSSNSQTYDLSVSNQLKFKINEGIEQTATVDSTAGYTESRVATTMGLVISTGINDVIDFSDGDVPAYTFSVLETFNLTDGDQLDISVNGSLAQTATFNTADFADITQATATEVAVVLNTDWIGITAIAYLNSVYIVHNISGPGNTIQITDSTGNPNIELGFSVALIDGYTEYLNITLAPGYYDGTTLATSIQTQLNAVGGSTYTVDYNITSLNKFTIVSDGSALTGTFSLLWNTGSYALQSSAYMLGFDSTSDDTGFLTYTSDYNSIYVVQTGVNDTFTMSLNGTLSPTVTITQGRYATAATLITEMTTQLNFVFSPASYSITYPISNLFTITSSRKGTTSIVEVYEGTTDFLQTIALDGDAPVYGGGDVGDITAVTAAEVANVIQAEISGVIAYNSSGKVYIETVATGFVSSSIEVTAASATAIIGFTLGTTYGADARNRLKVDIDGDLSQMIELNAGTNIAAAVVAQDIENKLETINTGGYANARCTWNETTVYQTFTDQLRIISGTYGSASSVNVTDKTIQIKSGINNSIDFEDYAYAATKTINTQTFNLNDGDQLGISVDSGVIQVATFNTIDFFNINAATAVEVAAVLNSAWSGVTAGDDAGKVIITHNTAGSSFNFIISDITGNPNIQLGFPTTLITNQLAAFITPGFYNGTTLATEIQTQMNAITVTNAYSISYNGVNNKMTLAAASAFDLLWSSGSHTISSIKFVLGFRLADLTGLTSYTSIGEVYDANVQSILFFNAQTIESGHDITSILIDNASNQFIGTIYWTSGSRLDMLIDTTIYNTVLALVNQINTFEFYNAQLTAFLQSRNGEKYTINPNDTLITSVNGAAPQTLTITGLSYGTSISGVNPYTRIVSGVNDRLKIVINNIVYEESVVNESDNVTISSGTFSVQNVDFGVKLGTMSGLLQVTVASPPFFIPVTTNIPLVENGNFTCNYANGLVTLSGWSSSFVTSAVATMSYTYFSGTEIILDTQNTPQKIAQRIQDEVRRIKDINIETRAAFLNFSCWYDSNTNQYALQCGIAGSTSVIKIYNASTANAAVSLKLGTYNGGVETAGLGGPGNIVNSVFATATEVAATINGLSPSGYSAGVDNGYLNLFVKNGTATRLQIQNSTLKEKLGFDSNNDDSYPNNYLINENVLAMLSFTAIEIFNAQYNAVLGWETDKGNVTIEFYTIDDSNIETREPLIVPRLAFIATREPQITARANDIQTALIPTLYQSRKDAVQLRLNRKTGSYIKVGDKIKESANTQNTITENNNFINDINALL